jgi:hypothetical protein
MKWGLTQPFRVPVDPIRDGAANYDDIVKHPMDLSTMKNKLSENQYEDVQSFVADVHLICSNAVRFNGENSMFGFIAVDVKNWMDEHYRDKPISQEDEWQRRLESVVTRLHEHIAKVPRQNAHSANNDKKDCSKGEDQ